MERTAARLDLGGVVVGVDGSPPAHTAMMWAAAEAALRGGTLSLVHATDTNAQAPLLSQAEIRRCRQAGRDTLDRAVQGVKARYPELTVIEELTESAAPESLRRAAALSGTVVVGHRGLGGFSSLLLGSVGLAVAAAATTPVVVVRGSGEPIEAGVVLAAVRDDNDMGCARVAAREAMLRKVPLRLLHVWSAGLPIGSREVRRRDCGEEAARLHVHALTSVSDQVREEFPALTVHADGQKSHSVPGALVDASHHADLLVIGGRRSPGYLGPTLGRTTLSLLQHARCPVELLPRRGPGHGSTS